MWPRAITSDAELVQLRPDKKKHEHDRHDQWGQNVAHQAAEKVIAKDAACVQAHSRKESVDVEELGHVEELP